MMTRICNFPISSNKHCKQPIVGGKPNCGRHKTNLSADQLGQNPTAYKKDSRLHVWAGEPDGPYCLIHSDPAYQVLCQLAGETLPCCLKKDAIWRDEHGLRHRDDGPARIWPSGTQEWWQHGELHREDGPAVIEADGTQRWYRRNERHREDGPAVIWSNDTQLWYWHDRLVTEEEHAKLRKPSLGV